MPAESWVSVIAVPSSTQLFPTHVGHTAARMGDEVQNPPGTDTSPTLALQSIPGPRGERRAGEGEGQGSTTCLLI